MQSLLLFEKEYDADKQSEWLFENGHGSDMQIYEFLSSDTVSLMSNTYGQVSYKC